MHLQMLRTLYDRAVNGLPALGAPAEEAQRLHQTLLPDEAADRLIHRAMLLSSATGFVCGMPGYLTMPITVPSNVAGVLLIQFHMCATIAALNDRDPHDAAVREHAIQCVLNSTDSDGAEESDDKITARTERESKQEASDVERSETEILGLLGRFTTKLGERGMRFIGEQAIRWAYRTARRTNRGSRSLPFLGGAIGAVTDGMDTQSVGKRARRVFSRSATREREASVERPHEEDV